MRLRISDFGFRIENAGTPATRARRLALRSAFGVCLCLVACRGNSDSTPSSRPRAVESVVRGGGATLTVRSERDHVAVAERFRLTASVAAPPEYQPAFPSPGATLGDFTVIETKDSPPIPEGAGRRTLRTYVLESDLSGTKSIPALTVAIARVATSQSAIRSPQSEISLESEPLSIEVTSELAENADLTKFRDIKGPFDIPGPFRWLWAAGVAAAVLAAGLIAWRWRRRQASLAQARRIPPHVLAGLAMNRLEEEHLPQRGEFHAYYFRLSGIVRSYIEARFGLMAPERTTEEFLAEARRGAMLSEEHKQTLGTFLQACDEVKFALYQPSVPEAERAMQTAREFVDRTTPTEALAS